MSIANRLLLPVIVFSQFACTSMWFAGNAVIAEIQADLGLEGVSVGPITSAVQFGFIVGTLVFAVFTIADRFSPSRVFFACAVLGALFNAAIAIHTGGLTGLILLRTGTGFMLAGIYPVGMKIASDHYGKGLGKALGFLVGALVVGTAFPHLVKGFSDSLSWKWVVYSTSFLSILGGVLILFLVPDGPHRKKRSRQDLLASFKVFKQAEFRSAAFGYFGHMWELYAFWAFLPMVFLYYQTQQPAYQINPAVMTFLVIAIGGLACVAGGYIALRRGSRDVAFFSLLSSGICCLASPLFYLLPFWLFFAGLLFWGMVVIADSPQFSTLVARAAPEETRGSALTIVNCIGFSITIGSIQLLDFWSQHFSFPFLMLLLLPGPLIGLYSLRQGI